MKKLIIVTLLVIIIPFLVVKIFVPTDEIKFKNMTNNIIRVKDEQGNITEIPFEEYVKGVVAGEMPATFEEEALKAQAVASRSYAMYQMEGSKDKDYDVLDTTTNQVYLTDEELKNNWKEEYPEKINKIKKAVAETKGEYLTYDGKVINAMFFSTSTGQTENSEDVFVTALPYLRSVASTWDEKSPVYTDTATISLQDFYNKLSLPYNETLTVEITSQTATGRIKTLKINGTEFNGRDFASKLSLRSNCFTISQNEQNITITTKGFGHGVGMSQYGANGMAKEGYNYKKILKHYYSNTKIEKI